MSKPITKPNMDKEDYLAGVNALIDLGERFRSILGKPEITNQEIESVAEAFNRLDQVYADIGNKYVPELAAKANNQINLDGALGEDAQDDEYFVWAYPPKVRASIEGAVVRMVEGLGTGVDNETTADTLDAIHQMYICAVTSRMRNVSIAEFPDDQIQGMLK